MVLGWIADRRKRERDIYLLAYSPYEPYMPSCMMPKINVQAIMLTICYYILIIIAL